MDIRNIKNWKENPKYQEIKLRMQDVKVKKTFRWIFEIAVSASVSAADGSSKMMTFAL